ncbi:hypothetical protein L596_011386 [Steinernema carpocapsae]|uniref:Tyrosine-protein phosphatase domain-containing protein n=1 Tax=Steinernema carpocapsae TaxID=34508 RepID=A0A4U5NU84_STECR|nr:hypothetical protein L596_011386 [Steinernema carpocapsae]
MRDFQMCEFSHFILNKSKSTGQPLLSSNVFENGVFLLVTVSDLRNPCQNSNADRLKSEPSLQRRAKPTSWIHFSRCGRLVLPRAIPSQRDRFCESSAFDGMASANKESPKPKEDKLHKSSSARTRKHRSPVPEDGMSVMGTAPKHDKDSPISPEAKEAMKKWVEVISQAGIHTLRMNYTEMKTFVPPDPSKTAFDQNGSKCRYKDVACFDKSRVVLKQPEGGDFIHANWVTHELLDNQFICCQGPLDATVSDFWWMVWQEKVKLIIMLCKCEELGKKKCSQYWPLKAEEPKVYNGITIKNEKVDAYDYNVVHTLLTLAYENEHYTLDHYQWITWPDRSRPKNPMIPFRLLHLTRQNTTNASIIHCSAGIGRTGTFVMIELIYKSLLQAKVPEMVALLKELRQQRAQAVQTEDQYVYVHYAILKLLTINNVISIAEARMFCKEYVKYIELLNDSGGKQLPLTATSLPEPNAYLVSLNEPLTLEEEEEKRNQEEVEKAEQEAEDPKALESDKQEKEKKLKIRKEIDGKERDPKKDSTKTLKNECESMMKDKDSGKEKRKSRKKESVGKSTESKMKDPDEKAEKKERGWNKLARVLPFVKRREAKDKENKENKDNGHAKDDKGSEKDVSMRRKVKSSSVAKSQCKNKDDASAKKRIVRQILTGSRKGRKQQSGPAKLNTDDKKTGTKQSGSGKKSMDKATDQGTEKDGAPDVGVEPLPPGAVNDCPSGDIPTMSAQTLKTAPPGFPIVDKQKEDADRSKKFAVSPSHKAYSVHEHDGKKEIVYRRSGTYRKTMAGAQSKTPKRDGVEAQPKTHI